MNIWSNSTNISLKAQEMSFNGKIKRRLFSFGGKQTIVVDAPKNFDQKSYINNKKK